MIFLSHIIIILGITLIPFTWLTTLPRRTHAITILLIIIGVTLLTITTNHRRAKLSSPIITIIGLVIWHAFTNQSITFTIVNFGIFFLITIAFLIAQNEKSALLEASLWRIINANERPLRRLTSLIIVSSVVFSGINLSRNCESLWNQWSLSPMAADIDTGLNQSEYIVDEIPRPNVEKNNKSKRKSLIKGIENTRKKTKTTATNMVITPQKMVFLSFCNASLHLRSGLRSQRRFQSGLIIVGTLLLVNILDIPILIIMGIARLFLSLIDHSKLLPKHRKMIEVEQWGKK